MNRNRILGLLAIVIMVTGATDCLWADDSKIPIIYADEYNISFWGLENLHPFDTKKYGRVFALLSDRLNLTASRIYQPSAVTDATLREIHSQHYLDSLKHSDTIARIAEINLLGMLPNSFLQDHLIDPIRFGTGGTLLGVDIALQYGWAINLSGGYHHAKADSGAGFCFFADIPLAVKKLLRKNADLNILIIDLDAHQGNGVSDILRSFPNVTIMDVYNSEIYPQDREAEQFVKFLYPLPAYTGDDEYLSLLKKAVPEAMEKAKATFIIYNAGTDIYSEDPLGAMKISREGIKQRDALIFENAIRRKIPILMLLSGGYTKDSAAIIAESIENVITNIIPPPTRD